MGLVTTPIIRNELFREIRSVNTAVYTWCKPPNGCQSVGLVNQVRHAGEIVENTLPSESRPRPQVLLMHPTGRAEQFTEVNWYAKSRTPWMWGASCCIYRETLRDKVTLPATTPPWTGWEERARNQIAKEAVNLSTSCFEYRQTAKLFTDTAKMVNNSWEEFRGRKRYRTKHTVSNIAAAKLTASFGLVPTLSDLSRSIDVLNATLGGDHLLRRHGGTVRGRKNLTQQMHLDGWFDGTWERSQKWSIYVAYYTDPRRLTMGNPVSLAWELTPWSWLIDGLVDVGSWLSALDALSGVRWMTGVLTTKDKQTASYQHRRNPQYEFIAPGKIRRQAYSRQVITTVPMPWRPTFVASSTYSKVVNATAALIAQRANPQYVNFDQRKLDWNTRRSLRKFFSFLPRT